jgi:mono/diheme cytochrome c family protein
MKRALGTAFAVGFVAICGPAWGDAASVGRGQVNAATGAVVYQHVCQGCHMPGARGAAGAGAYPALANNPKLAELGYPVGMVLNGHGGMPWFNGTLSDAQIAEVVNFVRTHFGNHYTDAATAEFVRSVRGPAPTMER